MRGAFLMLGLLAGGAAGCGPRLPARSAQPSNRVEQGVVIGVRGVAARFPVMAAFGGVADSLAKRAAVDTAVFEYIVRKANDDLVSVTQADRRPLALWQNVRVVAGNRARVVPDDAASADIIGVKPKVQPADALGEETLPAPAAALRP